MPFSVKRKSLFVFRILDGLEIALGRSETLLHRRHVRIHNRKACNAAIHEAHSQSLKKSCANLVAKYLCTSWKKGKYCINSILCNNNAVNFEI